MKIEIDEKPDTSIKKNDGVTQTPVLEATTEFPNAIVEDYNYIIEFFRNLKSIIFSPSNFFDQKADLIISNQGLMGALAFALIIDWVSNIFGFIYRSMIGAFLERHILELMSVAQDVLSSSDHYSDFSPNFGMELFQGKIVDFIFGAGSVLLSPFTTLFKLVIGAMFIHFGVRLIFDNYSERKHSFQATLKVLAFATAPWIFSVVPGLGNVIAWVLSFFVAVIGLRQIYKSTTMKAAIAVSFPHLIVMTFFMIFIFLLLMIGISLFKFAL